MCLVLLLAPSFSVLCFPSFGFTRTRLETGENERGKDTQSENERNRRTGGASTIDTSSFLLLHLCLCFSFFVFSPFLLHSIALCKYSSLRLLFPVCLRMSPCVSSVCLCVSVFFSRSLYISLHLPLSLTPFLPQSTTSRTSIHRSSLCLCNLSNSSQMVTRSQH